MEIYKDFTFESAHSLPHVSEGHKCKRVHGHSFGVRIYVEKDLDKKMGWVMDYAEIKEKFKPIYERIDHHYLNEIAGLENPTSENIAIWIWQELKPSLPELCKLEIRETCTSGCIYTGK